MALYVILLMGERNPYDGEGALRIQAADTPEEAVRLAHQRPPSTFKVHHAMVFETLEPWLPTIVELDVSSEWGRSRSALPSERMRELLAQAARSRT